MPSLSATVTLNRSDVAARIVRGGAREVGRRGDRLGREMQDRIKDMINRELGPTTGRAQQRGMKAMRDIEWLYTVQNPGKFPIVVTLYSPDLSGATGVKFGALNFGYGPSTRVGMFNFSGEKANREETFPVKQYNHPGWTGRNWLARVAAVISRRYI